MYNQEILNIAQLLEENKDKYCFAIYFADSALNEQKLTGVSIHNTGKKKFLDQIKNVEALGADLVIIHIHEKREGKCSAKPAIVKRIRLKAPSINQDFLGELGGLQGFIQTTVTLESLRKENEFLREEKAKLEREISELKQENKRLELKVQDLKEQIANLHWELREKELKGQNKFFESLGDLALTFLTGQTQTQKINTYVSGLSVQPTTATGNSTIHQTNAAAKSTVNTIQHSEPAGQAKLRVRNYDDSGKSSGSAEIKPTIE